MSEPVEYPPPSSGSGIKIPILFGAVIALLAANVYLFLQIDRLRTEMSKMRESLLTEVSNLRESSSVTTQAARRHLDTLRDELEAARRQAAMAAGQAKADALKRAEELAQKLETEQRKQEEQVKSQIAEVKTDVSATNAKVGEVKTEVGTVRTDVQSTRAELDKTIASLKTVVGDVGVQSGLIATNGKELAALKALGERNYFEFKLPKTKQPQKVGDIAVLLKRTDPKRHKYTVEVVADDKTVEKRDKNVNEPVQFYVAKAGRIPYEMVVNEVKKDQIVGYLSTPKVVAGRN